MFNRELMLMEEETYRPQSPDIHGSAHRNRNLPDRVRSHFQT